MTKLSIKKSKKIEGAKKTSARKELERVLKSVFEAGTMRLVLAAIDSAKKQKRREVSMRDLVRESLIALGVSHPNINTWFANVLLDKESLATSESIEEE
jgi:hypothetical protein